MFAIFTMLPGDVLTHHPSSQSQVVSCPPHAAPASIDLHVVPPRGWILPLLPQNWSLSCQVTAELVARDSYGSVVQHPLEQSHPQHHPRAARDLLS